MKAKREVVQERADRDQPVCKEHTTANAHGEATRMESTQAHDKEHRGNKYLSEADPSAGLCENYIWA